MRGLPKGRCIPAPQHSGEGCMDSILKMRQGSWDARSRIYCGCHSLIVLVILPGLTTPGNQGNKEPRDQPTIVEPCLQSGLTPSPLSRPCQFRPSSLSLNCFVQTSPTNGRRIADGGHVVPMYPPRPESHPSVVKFGISKHQT